MSIPAVAAILPEALGMVGPADMAVRVSSSPPVKNGTFASLLTGGIADVEAKVGEADRIARAFVIDDSIPVHQVTFALEQARMSLEMMLQVRSRIVESYQQLMTMQL